MGWRRTKIVVAALGLALMVTVALGLLWFDWNWKALIGWRALVDYINPENATGRKDAVQVYAVIVAGGIAFITAAVGLSNLGLTSRSLKQQRDLEAQRAQDTALQAYYEQIGKLLTEHDLLNTDREDIRALAKGQTLTVLRELDASRKKSVLSFLHEAQLIIVAGSAAAIRLAGADLGRAKLGGINLTDATLSDAMLKNADLEDANLTRVTLSGVALENASLTGANLTGATLFEATLEKADLTGATLTNAKLDDARLEKANLAGADLKDANLFGADLRGANLRGTDLQKADLRGARAMSQSQVDWAIGSKETKLPEGFVWPEDLWSKSSKEQREVLKERINKAE